jgi:hypothetical protein
MKAFPKVREHLSHEMQDGMDLRDYFAAKALQGICASQQGLQWSNQLIAKEAYDLADAMMEARK